MSLDALNPVEGVFQLVSALFGKQPPEEAKEELLKAQLQQYLDYQSQFYFLGIHPSWLEALLVNESDAMKKAFKDKHPVLMEVLKTKLVRMSRQDNLLELGKEQLSAYLVKRGKPKTAELLSKLPESIQDGVLADLKKLSTLAEPQQELAFLFDYHYDTAQDLFKQVGLYCKEPNKIQELAQRLEYQDGQKLIVTLKAART